VDGGNPASFIWWRCFVPNVSKTTLTQQLRELERDGILSRTVYAEVPPRVEYTLTERGETALPILKAMCAWGQQQLMRAKEEE
jgi:DNA-binding HxlR family transcriptional regulator